MNVPLSAPLNAPKAPKAHDPSRTEPYRAGEPERAEGSRAPVDPDPLVAAKSPKQLATHTPIPPQGQQGSTLPSQPATKQPVEKVVQPAETLDAMPSTEPRADPALSSSQAPAPVASMDAMEIEQSANPPDNTPLNESNRQPPTNPGQETIDAAAKHRTVLKEIWAKRVL